MISRLSAVFVAVLVCHPVMVAGQAAEVAGAERIEGGVKGGVTFSDIPGFADLLAEEAAADTDYRIGAVVGGFVAFPLGRYLSLQPEVLWAQRGIEGSLPAIGEAFALKLTYIDMPVLLRIGPSSSRGFQVLAGPSFNVNIGAQLIVGDTFNDEEDYKDEVEDIDVGLVVGAGYYGGLMIIEGRYQEGLRSTAALTGESVRNRGFVAMVGIRFGRSAAKPAP
jgi:hypothetical protein